MTYVSSVDGKSPKLMRAGSAPWCPHDELDSPANWKWLIFRLFFHITWDLIAAVLASEKTKTHVLKILNMGTIDIQPALPEHSAYSKKSIVILSWLVVSTPLKKY